MKHSLMIHLALAFCLCVASVAQAHHSHPNFYDECKSFALEGQIESVQWIDPHTLVVVQLDDGRTYTLDWSGLRGLTNTGVLGPAQAALVPGARIAVTGNPIRTSAEIRKFFPEYTHEVSPNIVDPTRIRRVDDSWSWGRTPMDRMPTSPPASCAPVP
jgi:hypothetical protein